MKKQGIRALRRSVLLLALFALWTILIQVVDVQPAGETGTMVGFATLNSLFHQWTGVHLWLYTATDWLSLAPVCVVLCYAGIGAIQWIRRKHLLLVDPDILLLGVYYAVVISCYLFFEMVPIHYRPVLLEGRMEASYPSSTTLLVLSVMPTLIFRLRPRKWCVLLTMGYSIAMVAGRLISGVHWLVDIAGSLLLSGGLFSLYQAAVWLCCRNDDKKEGFLWNFTKNYRNCGDTGD